MTTLPDPPAADNPVAEKMWQTRWLLVGLTFLLLWRSAGFIDREWLARYPEWLMLLLTGFLPQLVLLVYPLVTRSRNSDSPFQLPTFLRSLTEFAIAIPLVILTLVTIGTVNYLIGRLSPGTTLTPEVITNMTQSTDVLRVGLMLLFASTFAPVAEEIFFRGFLQNAFKSRMPRALATIIQCLLFGFCHFFGTTHAVVAVVLGLMLTVVYEWRKTILAPILVHAGINGISTLLVLLSMWINMNTPYLGILNDPNEPACVIQTVFPGTPAEAAGLMPGDVIVQLDDYPIQDFQQFTGTLVFYDVGDRVTITVERDGETLQLEAVLQRRPRR